MSSHRKLIRFLSTGWVLLIAVLPIGASDFQLGAAPKAPSPAEVEALRPARPGLLSRTGPFEVDTSIREQVRLFHQLVYHGQAGTPDPLWTGGVSTCEAGTTAAEFQESVIRRINYFRALAGVPAGVTLHPEFSGKAQEAALMMSANNALSHFPPATWSCYTAEGAEAARSSNLAIGRLGPHAVDGYMEDFGGDNAAAGHRRWLLYPQTQTMGTGDVPATVGLRPANVVWVFDGNYGTTRPATRDEFVSWPPPGYVPYQVIYPRWSFSYPGADFTQCTVSLSVAGEELPITVEPFSGGMGENTVVWYPAELSPQMPYQWPRPAADKVYEVAVRQVLVGGNARDFVYHVIVMDPDMAGFESEVPVISGPIESQVDQPVTFTLSGVPDATAYQYRVARRSPFTAVEGAEDGEENVQIEVSQGYEVVVSDVKASGSYAYRLTHSILTPQYLTYLPVLIPGANARLEFQSRLGWASVGQVARVQVRVGGVGAWRDVYTQAGSGGSGELSFIFRSVSLSSFTDRSIEIRFVYDGSAGSYFPGIDPGIGWYLDDIAVLDTEELRETSLSPPFEDEFFDWIPTEEGDFALDARAQYFDGFYAEWGFIHALTAVGSVAPPVLRFVGPPTLRADHLSMDFAVDNHQPGQSYQLMRKAALDSAWSVEENSVFETLVPAGRFRVIVPLTELLAAEFFQLHSN